MTELFVAGVGGVLSADIAVPEHEREKRFYSRVLRTGEHPLWREDLMNNMGMPIIGLGMQTAEYADLPLQWMPHIQVADVGESVERALSLGGRALRHAKDKNGTSQWAVVSDPNAATFGLVPVIPAGAIPPLDSGDSTDAVGRISSIDLTAHDASAAADFYRQVVGWRVERVDDADDYTLLSETGSVVGRIRHAHGVNADLPHVWLIRLPVGDLAESLRCARAEGGAVVQAIEGEQGQYMSAVVRDPVGTHLGLVALG